METALKKLLESGIIGEKLLDSNGQRLLQEVESLRRKYEEAKENFQKVSTLKLRQEKDVTYMRQMLEILQELTMTYKKDGETGLRHEKDMFFELEGCQRHQNQLSDLLHKLVASIDQIQNQKIRQEREIEELQKDMDVDSSLLQEILDHLSLKEEDNLLLLRFISAEASQMKTMSVALEKLSEEVAEAERHYRVCKHEAAAQKTVRSQLVTFFLKEAARRDDLLLQWEATLDELKAKMNDETTVIEDILRLQNRMASLGQSRDREVSLLQQVESSIQELNDFLEEAEKESETLSLQHTGVLEALQETKGQVASFGSCRRRLISEIAETKSQIKSSQELHKEKSAFLTRLELKCSKLEAELLLETEFLSSSEQSLRALETIKKECEHQKVMLEKQISLIRNLRQRHLQEASTMETENQILKGQLMACMSAKTRITKDIRLLKERMAKCDQLIYSQELETHDLKSRIYNLSHDANNNAVTNDPKNGLILLKERLSETSQGILLLKRTISVLQTHKFCSENDKDLKEKEVLQLEENVVSLQKLCNNIERDKVKLQREKEDLLVDISLTEFHFQMRLQHLSELRESNFQIAEQRRDVEMLMKEECSSLLGTIAATKTQVRELEIRQTAVLKDLYSMKTKLQQIQEKYFRIRTSVNLPDDEEEISPLCVMLKLAKEREGLQETGDTLDHEVKKAEDEVEALRKILSLLSGESDHFRSQLHHLIHHSEEDTEKLDLENKLSSLEDDIKIWSELQEQENLELQRTKEQYREMELQAHAVEDLLHEKNVHVREVEKEIGTQQMKTHHAQQATATLKSRLHSKNSKLADIELRITQERLKVVNALLSDVVSAHSEVSEATALYCQQENVPPPKVNVLTRRSDFGSRSSLGSLPSSKGEENDASRKTSGKKLTRHSSMTSLSSQDSGSSSVLSIQQLGMTSTAEPRSGSCPSSGHRALRRSTKNEGRSTTKKTKKLDIKNLKKNEDNNKESIVHLINPDFPKGILLRQEFKGNKILQKPSFRI